VTCSQLYAASTTLDRLADDVGVQRCALSLSRYALAHRIRLTLNLRDMQPVCVVRPARSASQPASNG